MSHHPLLSGYDEPRTLSYQMTLFGPISADVRQILFLIKFYELGPMSGVYGDFVPHDCHYANPNAAAMKGRICFPTHNREGEQIAYSGRWVASDKPKNIPGYLLPKGFEKSRVLFNLNRVLAHEGTTETIVIVEGFWTGLCCAAITERGHSRGFHIRG
jgi:hypothetical protein